MYTIFKAVKENFKSPKVTKLGTNHIWSVDAALLNKINKNSKEKDIIYCLLIGVGVLTRFFRKTMFF